MFTYLIEFTILLWCMVWLPDGKDSVTAYMDLINLDSSCPTERAPTCSLLTDVFVSFCVDEGNGGICCIEVCA